ncbi:MAG TPA: Holliday junction resolvase RuvX [Tepidisphaeraceae bacterium]|nr:Holliday junction resolvase RuvX [Tepidisphaeraceae bacterium]
MRTLAIDLGSRRVGLALSDAAGQLASPLRVLTVTSPDQAIAPILSIIRDESVERLVLGLPINMDDSLGPAARGVMAWAKQLQSQSNLPLIFVDERLSSFAAEQDLIARKRLGEKLTRKRKKEQLDALAAASFLQAFLDGKLKPIV